ncbi:MAG TPA: S4 domain-containing protein, partial [Candidatus Latescibacteria bacterium]|nr:S4 domain-containing protein [Candidatus Latescibacterota bacterium]
MNAPADNACVVRVNVFLSRCGVASRRSADKLIASSRVTVNGLPAELGARIDTTQDVVCLDGRVITPVE